MLTVGGLLMALLNGISATLILSFNLEQEDNVVVSYIVVCLVCLFVLIFTGSWYVVPYIVNAEIFPLEMRGISAAITSSSYFFTSAIVSQLFPYIFSVLRSYGVLYLVGCINVTAALYFWILFPETKTLTS
ncbi:uncharacterized protein LOC135346692 isoform X2 [Halichondria panicea]|uniref:uncharacterized protein LOC135346692 isoform X2 n=1 Tax=Halichondria panicea TaxID=6063 RepID=UPI00312BA6AA